MEAVSLNTKKIYPLTDWKKGHCLQYIKQQKLPNTINYGNSKSNSSGVGFTKDVMEFCKKYYPEDYKKILNVFPFLDILIIQPIQNEPK